MKYIAVVRVGANGRIEKYQEYPTEAEAAAHVERVVSSYPTAFVAQDPGGNFADWLCDPVAKTMVLDPLPPPSKPTIEAQIAAWLAANPFADALIRAMNKPTTDPSHLPPNAGLAPVDLVAKIKANLK